MIKNSRKDYYEILQLSPRAHADSIDKMFRHFAQRYHPDNTATGDSDMFQLVIEAHEVLKDPKSRAKFDFQREKQLEQHTVLLTELIGNDAFESDAKAQSIMLSMLYFKCREDFSHPGMSMFEMLKLLDIPREQMSFHIWYLKGKGWISRTDDGLFAITVEGVDQVAENKDSDFAQRRIEDNTGKTIQL